MKKHIFGFALFSFIVGTTVFIYTMLNIISIEEVNTPVDYSNYAQAKSCWRMKRESNLGSPVVKQAVFNLKTKQLKWELDRSNNDAPIALNFFVKDENGTRFIHSTLVPMLAYGDSFVRATSSYDWLDNLDSYENLYVTAETLLPGEYQNKNFSVKFDASKATPVLVY